MALGVRAVALTSRQRKARYRDHARSGSGAPLAAKTPRKLSHKRLPPERPQWEILDSETSAAYEVFKIFRDMNPLERSIAAVAKIIGRTVGTVMTLSSDHSWSSRAAAWDYHIEQARLELSEQYQLDMFKRHADVCKELVAKVQERLTKLKPSELKPRDVAQWIDIATKIERLSRGVANDSVAANLTQINVQVENMSRLTDQELEKIIDQEKKRKMRINAIDVKAALPEVTDGNS